MEITNLLQAFSAAYTASPEIQPPHPLISRLSYLSTAIHAALEQLASRTSLDASSGFDPAPPGLLGDIRRYRSLQKDGKRRKVKPKQGPVEGEEGTGRGEAEKEMELIRRRRDALIAKAKEAARESASASAAGRAGGDGGARGSQKGGEEDEGRNRGGIVVQGNPGDDTGMREDHPGGLPGFGHYTAFDPSTLPLQYPYIPNHPFIPALPFTHQLPPHQFAGSQSDVPIPLDFNLDLELDPPHPFMSIPTPIPQPAGSTATDQSFNLSFDLDLPLDMPILSEMKRNQLAMRGRCTGCGVSVEGDWFEGPDGPKSLCGSCGVSFWGFGLGYSSEDLYLCVISGLRGRKRMVKERRSVVCGSVPMTIWQWT